MRLTLTYKGRLPATQRGVSTVKADLRAAFDPQIRAQITPFLYSHEMDRIATIVDGHTFVAPAHNALHTAIDLDILLLTKPTSKSRGDTDNRLKTLIDGLTRPANSQQMRDFTEPSASDRVTFCLMDSDELVQRITIDSRRWFDPSADDQDAFAVITATFVIGNSASLDSPIANLPLLL